MKRFLLYSGVVFLLLACAKSEILEPAESLDGMSEGIELTPSAEPVPTFTRELMPVSFSAGIEANPADAPANEPQAPATDGEGTNSEENPDSEEGDAVEPEEEGTKAYVDRPHFYWQTGDEVGIYGDTFPGKYKGTATANASDARYATVVADVPGIANHWYGVYPTDAAAVFSDGSCTLTLPHVQTMGDKNVDPAALVAVTTGENMALSFHNVFALLSFKVSNADITHIQLIGNKGSVIAGTVVVDPATGNVKAVKDPRTEIHLYPKSGDTYFRTNTEYFVPILPYVSGVTGSLIGDVLFNGFTLIMYTGDEKTNNEKCYIKRTDKTLTLVRNQGQKLGNICSGCTTSWQSYSNDCNTRFYNSSMLNFGFVSTADQPYRAAVYSNPACTNLVVAHNISAEWITTYFSNHSFAYISVGGLEPGTPYYFRGINMATGQPTMIRSFTTNSFTVKEIAKTAAVGDVVLAEDFSELCYHATRDMDDGSNNIYGAGPYKGHLGSVSALVPYRGELPEGNSTDGPVYYSPKDEEARLFAFYRTALPATRLADWAEYSERQLEPFDAGKKGYDIDRAPVCARNGLLKIGASGYTGGIVTPPLDFIPAGKKATISVKVKASRFDADEKYLGVKSVSGSIQPIPSASEIYSCDRYFVVDQVYDTKTQTLDDNNDFKEYTLSLTAYPGNRIIIGADRTTPGTSPGTQCRLLVSEVTLTLTELDNIPTTQGALTLSKVSWTEGTVSWTSTAENKYQVYVDGRPYCDELVTASSDATTQQITGLHNGTTYNVEVKNVTTPATPVDVGSIYMTTASLWQNTNSAGQRFVSIGWDPLGRADMHGDDTAYEVQVCSSDNESAKIYEIIPQPGQKNDNGFLYGNAGIYGDGHTKGGGYVSQDNGITCENYLTPIGISIGGLHPGSTYYVRVRTLDSSTYTRYDGNGAQYTSNPSKRKPNPATITSSLGTSAWSDFLTVTTDSAHIPASNELFYCAFEDACVQPDFSNRTVGVVPYASAKQKALENVRLAYDADGRTAVWEKFCCYMHNDVGHQFDTWNIGQWGYLGIDGSLVVRGYKSDDAGTNRNGVNINNAEVGDFAGWCCSVQSKPVMGQLQMIKTDGGGLPFLISPALTDAYLGPKKLSPSGTVCTLSFYAVHTQYRHDSITEPNLNIFIWRAAQGAWESSAVASFPFSPDPESPLYPCCTRAWGDVGVNDTYYYKNDYSKRPSKHFSTQLTLYPGDAIKFESSYNHGNYGFILDDILLVKN